MGRVDPDPSSSTYPTAPLRYPLCKKVATRLLRLSSRGNVTSDVVVPYEFPSSAVRREMANAARIERERERDRQTERGATLVIQLRDSERERKAFLSGLSSRLPLPPHCRAAKESHAPASASHER